MSTTRISNEGDEHGAAEDVAAHSAEEWMKLYENERNKRIVAEKQRAFFEEKCQSLLMTHQREIESLQRDHRKQIEQNLENDVVKSIYVQMVEEECARRWAEFEEKLKVKETVYRISQIKLNKIEKDLAEVKKHNASLRIALDAKMDREVNEEQAKQEMEIYLPPPPSNPHFRSKWTKYDVDQVIKIQRHVRAAISRKRLRQTVFTFIRSPHSKGMRQRLKIMVELINTEKAYVDALDTIMKQFYTPLNDFCISKKPILSPLELHQVFGNVSQIYSFHQVLLQTLENKLRAWPVITLGDVFDQMSPLFVIYIEYVNHYNAGAQILTAERKRNQSFDKFLKKVKSTVAKCNGLELNSFLIMPVQRLPRYVLLLNQLIEHTPKDHIDYDNLTSAKKKIEDILAEINEKKRELENKQKLIEVQDMINKDSVQIDVPGRKYLRENDAVFSCDNGKTHKGEAFLFNDALVLFKKSKKKSDPVFKFMITLDPHHIESVTAIHLESDAERDAASSHQATALGELHRDGSFLGSSYLQRNSSMIDETFNSLVGALKIKKKLKEEKDYPKDDNNGNSLLEKKHRSFVFDKLKRPEKTEEKSESTSPPTTPPLAPMPDLTPFEQPASAPASTPAQTTTTTTAEQLLQQAPETATVAPAATPAPAPAPRPNAIRIVEKSGSIWVISFDKEGMNPVLVEETVLGWASDINFHLEKAAADIPSPVVTAIFEDLPHTDSAEYSTSTVVAKAEESETGTAHAHCNTSPSPHRKEDADGDASKDEHGTEEGGAAAVHKRNSINLKKSFSKLKSFMHNRFSIHQENLSNNIHE